MIYKLNSKGFWKCPHGLTGTEGSICPKCEVNYIMYEKREICTECKKEIPYIESYILATKFGQTFCIDCYYAIQGLKRENPNPKSRSVEIQDKSKDEEFHEIIGKDYGEIFDQTWFDLGEQKEPHRIVMKRYVNELLHTVEKNTRRDILKKLPEPIKWESFLQVSERCEGLGFNTCLKEIIKILNQ